MSISSTPAEYGEIAEQAGIDRHLWEPDAMGITTANEMIEPLHRAWTGIVPSHASIHLANWIGKYVSACEKFPDAQIVVSRALDAEEKAAMRKAEADAKAGKV